MNASASLIFVGFREGVSKKTNKSYKMLELSDGISSKMFSTILSGDDFVDYKRGDEVNVLVQVNFFDEYNTFTVVGISGVQ